MTTRKGGARPTGSRHMRGERIKDEVYRQMFRLEERRPGAEMDLALALLRACVAIESKPASDEERDWLKKVLPICLEMIEAGLQALGNMYPCVQ